MTKELRCADVGFDCQAVMSGETEDEVMAQAADHARSVHNMSDSDLQQNEPAIRAAIHDA
jgi:predicted small metal-binding protein